MDIFIWSYSILDNYHSHKSQQAFSQLPKILKNMFTQSSFKKNNSIHLKKIDDFQWNNEEQSISMLKYLHASHESPCLKSPNKTHLRTWENLRNKIITGRKGSLGAHQQARLLWDLGEFPAIVAEFLLEPGWGAHPVQFPPGTPTYHHLSLLQPSFLQTPSKHISVVLLSTKQLRFGGGSWPPL